MHSPRMGHMDQNDGGTVLLKKTGAGTRRGGPLGMKLVKTIAIHSPTIAQKPSVPVLLCRVPYSMDSLYSSSLIHTPLSFI